MSIRISVHPLPVLFEPQDLRGGIAVIVDILRASTTIAHALANGADGVIPCASVDDALQSRKLSTPGTCLLGGERGGIRIEGFDLSNSPDDYLPAVVRGKTIGFTTTNGTRALLRSKQADRIIVGAFVNFSQVLDNVLAESKPVHIVCAGTDGVITGEDVLFAGALAAAIVSRHSDAELTDATSVAISHWVNECDELSSQSIEPALRRALGGRNLIRLGYDRDIATAAAVDAVSVVGILDDQNVIRREEANFSDSDVHRE